jgi:hypothetical protein
MNKAFIITSINKPNTAMKLFAEGSKNNDVNFIVVGDKKSPKDFHLDGCQYLDLEAQINLFPKFCELLPIGHYARKNIGYLQAIKQGARLIVESDDDNLPYETFFNSIGQSSMEVDKLETNLKWYNIYRLFSDSNVWPRGLPLECIKQEYPADAFTKTQVNPLIIQGLADDNPDVDSIFRLVMDLPLKFKERNPVVLPKNVWCPFNSQNTVFYKQVFALTYLPSYCSFRMTDIWRSFIAQRCLWELDNGLIFTSSTVYQERNEHNLLKDFEDEVPGFLFNNKIADILTNLSLSKSDIYSNLYTCYEALVKNNIIGEKELKLVELWIAEIKALNPSESL